MEIHELNKLLEKFVLNEMSMYENPRKDFAEFRQYVLDNPKAKKSYFIWNDIRIPSDTILHSLKRHILSLSQWKEFLENYENIIDQKQTNKRRYGGNSTIYVIQINKNKYYCYVLESFESDALPIITTVFEDHKIVFALGLHLKNKKPYQGANQPPIRSQPLWFPVAFLGSDLFIL